MAAMLTITGAAQASGNYYRERLERR